MRRRTAAIALFALVFAAYMLTYSRTLDLPADEGNMFLVTESIVKFGGVSIDQGNHLQYISQADLDANGSRYAKYGIGQSLAAAPLYALGLLVPAFGLVDIVLLLNPLLMALSAVVLMLAAWELGASRGRAVAVALIFALCTPAWVYAKGFYSEPLATLGFALAAWGATGMLVRLAAAGETPRRGVLWGAALAGAGIGLAMLSRASEAVAAPVLLLAIWFYVKASRKLRREVLAAAAAPIVAAGLAILLYNWVRFGSPLNGGYGTETFNVWPWVGAWGMLFAPGRSLFIYAPVMLLAAPGLWLLRKPAGLRAWLIGTALAVLVLHGAWWSWWGAWSWGPRFLVPVLPLLALGLLGIVGLGRRPVGAEGKPARPQGRRLALSAAVAALAVLGILIQLPGVAVYRAFFFWDVMKYFPKANPDEVSLYTFRFFMPLTNLREAFAGNLDFAWKQGLNAPFDRTALLLAVAGVVAAAAGLIMAWRSRRLSGVAALVSLLLVLGLAGGSLAHYQRKDNNPFNAVVPAIARLVPSDGILVIGDRTSDTNRLLWNADRVARRMIGAPGDPYWVDHQFLPMLKRAVAAGRPLWYLQTEEDPPPAMVAALEKMGQCDMVHRITEHVSLNQWTACEQPGVHRVAPVAQK